MTEVELTIKVFDDVETIISALEQSKYKYIDKYVLNDKYLFKNDQWNNVRKNKKMKSVLMIRVINDSIIQILMKHKKYKKGVLESTNSDTYETKNYSDCMKYFNSIGYYSRINIVDRITEYEKSNIKICIQDVEKMGLFLEIEYALSDNNHDVNEIKELLKQELENLNINYDKSDYLVRKVDIALNNNI